jgi:hypothetical protein
MTAVNGRFTMIGPAPDRNGEKMVSIRCECGTEKTPRARSFFNGSTMALEGWGTT